MHPTPTLAPDYYLANFNRLISHATSLYKALLTQGEIDSLNGISQLGHEAQCLLVRLYSRKGEWFRSDKLAYDEIPNVPHSLNELEQAQFVDLVPQLSTRQLAECLLTKTEILTLYPDLDKKSLKQDLVNALPVDHFDRFSELPFRCIHLRENELCELLLGLFFANTYQDLSQFVLEDLGLHQFEPYRLSKKTRYFKNRQQVDQLLALGRLRKQYDGIDRRQKSELLRLIEGVEEISQHTSIEAKQQKFFNEVARDLERLNCLPEALNVFRKSRLPPARERIARIFDKLDDTFQMETIVNDMIALPFDVSESETAQKLMDRVERKKGNKVPRKAKPTIPERHLVLDLSQQRVELAVKAYFEQQGDHVYFVENQFLTGLFGLHFWNVIFADIEGAFVNPYQHKPLDLYHHDFRAKRSALVEEHYKQLDESGYTTIKHIFNQKYGRANPFVHWPSMSLEIIEAAEKTIPISLLSSLFNVLFNDIALYRNGMPDLIAFRGNEFEWIEVKGPGDKLQDNQWRWMKRFQELDIPFSVCYVKDSNH
ncbi:VRR-NUC domain-containing protein [Vibrio amylolyticus]|uniref:VRR-NUC domain-containing protein n=1 Tax=Vibrio amylolyticus TaxID=2847292 RepID=UPI003551ACE7